MQLFKIAFDPQEWILVSHRGRIQLSVIDRPPNGPILFKGWDQGGGPFRVLWGLFDDLFLFPNV